MWHLIAKIICAVANATVIINAKTGESIRGVFWERRPGFIVLRGAELLRHGDTPLMLDGEVLVPADNVSFIQVV